MSVSPNSAVQSDALAVGGEDVPDLVDTLAVDIARECGLTLVGFVRGGSLNVYAGAERLGLTI